MAAAFHSIPGWASGPEGAAVRWHASQPPPQREIGAIPPPIRRSGSSTAASRQGVFIRSRRRRRGRRERRDHTQRSGVDGGQFGHLAARGKKNLACAVQRGRVRGQDVVGASCVSGRCWPRSGSASLGVRSKVPASGPKDCFARRINSARLIE